MIRTVGRVFRATTSGSPAQRAVDATLADWRHERAAASTTRQRCAVDLKSAVALFRTVARAGAAEFPLVLKSSLLPRLAAATAIWTAWTVWNNGLPGDQRFFLVAPSSRAWTLVAASLTNQLMTVFPLIVFAAEAPGRRDRVAPMLGSLALLVGCGLMLTLVVWPAAFGFIRYETWRYFANASQTAPDMGALWRPVASIVAAVAMATILVVAFALARGVRRVGGLAGWSVGVGPVLGVYSALMVFLATNLRFNIPLNLRVAVLLLFPVAMVAGVLWSVSRLAAILSTRSTPLSAVELSNSK